ncbi:unnamed protein product [Dibothriocephalus latus]|uniref:Uncharacterized protein n=1 Tax=Dibothriocephalus latus TaxID=60516 RepID=A0A3P7MLT6_DIBLA|nr:unnamed protein product [Dibothriocephalus latus]
MIGWPPVITSNKKARNVSGGFLQLTGELVCDVSFDGTQFKGTLYLTKRPNLNLIGLDWIEKLGLLALPLNYICNSVQSTWTSPAASNQLAAKLTSTLQEKIASVFQDGLGDCNQMKHTECTDATNSRPNVSRELLLDTFDLPNPRQETAVTVQIQDPQYLR